MNEIAASQIVDYDEVDHLPDPEDQDDLTLASEQPSFKGRFISDEDAKRVADSHRMQDNLHTMYRCDRYNKSHDIRHLAALEDAGPQIRLFIAVLRQARTDSMPGLIFNEKSKDALFNSILLDSFDAYSFMSSSRMDIYAHCLGIDPATLRRTWKADYDVWRKKHGPEIVENIIRHAIKLICTNREGTVVYADSYSFCRSPNFRYWAFVANREPEQFRKEVLERIQTALADVKSVTRPGTSMPTKQIAMFN